MPNVPHGGRKLIASVNWCCSAQLTLPLFIISMARDLHIESAGGMAAMREAIRY
jgi:hypothetical protein